MSRAWMLATVGVCLLAVAGCGDASRAPSDPATTTQGQSVSGAGAPAEPVIQFDRVSYSYGASGEHASARVRVAYDAVAAGWMVARIQSPGRDGAAPRVHAEAIVALSEGRTAVLDLAVPDSVLASADGGVLEAAAEVRDGLGKVVVAVRRGP